MGQNSPSATSLQHALFPPEGAISVLKKKSISSDVMKHGSFPVLMFLLSRPFKQFGAEPGTPHRVLSLCVTVCSTGIWHPTRSRDVAVQAPLIPVLRLAFWPRFWWETARNGKRLGSDLARVGRHRDTAPASRPSYQLCSCRRRKYHPTKRPERIA